MSGGPARFGARFVARFVPPFVARLVARVMARVAPAGTKRAEFVRYLFVGGTNTVITYLIYLAGLLAGLAPLWAYNISFAAGVCLSYVLNLKFTFRQKHHWKKMLKFPLVYLVQYIVGAAALEFFLQLGFSAPAAGLLIIPLVIPVTFVLARVFLR